MAQFTNSYLRTCLLSLHHRNELIYEWQENQTPVQASTDLHKRSKIQVELFNAKDSDIYSLYAVYNA